MARNDKHVAVFTAYEDTQPWDPATPEKNLLRALLITAMADAKKSGNVRKMALEYFLDPDEKYILSFRSVCSHLNVDPASVLVAIGLVQNEEKEKRAA